MKGTYNNQNRKSGGYPKTKITVGKKVGGQSLPCDEKRHADCDGYLTFFPHLKGYACQCGCHKKTKVEPTVKYGEPCPKCGLSWAHGSVPCDYIYPDKPIEKESEPTVERWEPGAVGKNVHSVYTHCRNCWMWGINMPLDKVCGNCGKTTDIETYYDSETITKLLDESVQEAKAERDRELIKLFKEWVDELPDDATCMAEENFYDPNPSGRAWLLWGYEYLKNLANLK